MGLCKAHILLRQTAALIVNVRGICRNRDGPNRTEWRCRFGALKRLDVKGFFAPANEHNLEAVRST